MSLGIRKKLLEDKAKRVETAQRKRLAKVKEAARKDAELQKIRNRINKSSKLKLSASEKRFLKQKEERKEKQIAQAKKAAQILGKTASSLYKTFDKHVLTTPSPKKRKR